MNQLYNVADIYRINPLEATSAIISMETLKEIRQLEDVDVHGYTILDRWATYQPNELKRLESDGFAILFHHLFRQQSKELDVLLNTSYTDHEQHLSIAERLQLHEIDTRLVREF
jgi:hypothetical protein